MLKIILRGLFYSQLDCRKCNHILTFSFSHEKGKAYISGVGGWDYCRSLSFEAGHSRTPFKLTRKCTLGWATQVMLSSWTEKESILVQILTPTICTRHWCLPTTIPQNSPTYYMDFSVLSEIPSRRGKIQISWRVFKYFRLFYSIYSYWLYWLSLPHMVQSIWGPQMISWRSIILHGAFMLFI